MKSPLVVAVIFFLCIGLNLQAQREITLMNGYKFSFDSVKYGSDEMLVLYKKKGHEKSRAFEYGEIFSVTTNGLDSIIYNDSFGSGIPTEEMKMNVTGYSTVRENYNGTAPAIVAFIGGVATAYYAPSVLALPIIPAMVVVSMQLPVNYSRYPHSEYGENDSYRWAVKRQVKSQRASKVLISSVAGFAVGLLVNRVAR